jgi:predicted PurR-regulated permease PerM
VLPITQRPLTFRYTIAAWCLAALLLLLVLFLHLVPSLFAGLLVYELVHVLAPRLRLRRLGSGKLIAVALLSIVVVTALTFGLLGAISFFRSEAGSVPALLQKMAEIIEGSRAVLPAWVVEHLPGDTEALKQAITEWLRSHSHAVQVFGAEAGRVTAHILLGMVIGAMVALREAQAHETHGPLATAMVERATRLGDAFRRVVFAQVRIAAINAVFTGVYLAVVLPLMGIKLPLTKTMIAITFIAGLLPVVGNLISNTVIVVVSLSVSLKIALASLAFLVLIHKLEYFLNARIIGTQIRANAWELLLAMLLMEAAFGLPGLVAAPVLYAYLKDELSARGLI